MDIQRTLFANDPDQTPRFPPAQQHSETSIAAAVAIAPQVNELQAIALGFFLQAGEQGLTDEQLSDLMRRGGSTARPRRIELVEKGLVRDSGRTRPGRSGKKMTVWTIV